MASYRQNLKRALKSDGLLLEVARAFHGLEKGLIYICGSYVTDVVCGSLSPRGMLLACSGDTRRVSERIAQSTGCVLIELSGGKGIYTLSGRKRRLRNITVAPLGSSGIDARLKGSGFVVGAMAVDLAALDSPEIIDPLCALVDIDQGRLRAVSRGSIQGDPVKVLLAAELCHQYRISPDPGTEDALEAAAGGLRDVAPGRIRTVLCRLLADGGVSGKVRFLRRVGALSVLLPEVEALYDVPQNYYHHLGVWDHTLEVLDYLQSMIDSPSAWFPAHGDRITSYLRAPVEAGADRSALLMFAGLIHDIGKVSSMTVESSGRIRFQGHQLAGASQAREISRRLNFGYRGRSYVSGLVGQHMRLGFLIKDGETTMSRLRTVRELGTATIGVAMLSLADRLATRGEASTEEALKRFRRIVMRIVNDYYWDRDNPALLGGRDLLVHAGTKPDREMSRCLFALRVAQREGTVSNMQQALEFVAPDFKGRMSNKMV